MKTNFKALVLASITIFAISGNAKAAGKVLNCENGKTLVMAGANSTYGGIPLQGYRNPSFRTFIPGDTECTGAELDTDYAQIVERTICCPAAQ